MVASDLMPRCGRAVMLVCVPIPVHGRLKVDGYSVAMYSGTLIRATSPNLFGK